MRTRILLPLLLALLPFHNNWAQNNRNFDTAKMLEIFNNIYRHLDYSFVDTLDANRTIGTAITAMLENLDPYTEYYTEDGATDLITMTTGKYAGIGAGVRYHKGKERVVFEVPNVGQPAHQGGVRMGDVIMAIDGKDVGTRGKQDVKDYLQSLVNQLRGDAGSTFTLTVQRPGTKQPLHLRIVRARITQPSVLYAGLVANDAGLIVLNAYTEDTSKDFKAALEQLQQQGAKKLIIDLRSNGGGLMDQAVEVVNNFLPQGKLVLETRGKSPDVVNRYHTENQPFDLHMPSVVLVNGATASAAEITAGTLQDYDRAVIMGQRTFGKGLVQSSRSLPYHGILKFTSARYYIPSGRCVQAYDFSQRGADGTPRHLPDSLAKSFRTQAGRVVKDGGGIQPDVRLQVDSLPNLLIYLSASDELFDYCADYCRTHKQVADPTQFTLTDEEFDDFKRYMAKTSFTYDNVTLRALQRVKDLAKLEGYSEVAAEAFETLETKLKHNLTDDLERWKPQVKEELEKTIIEHFYGQQGQIVYVIHRDKDIKAANELLHNNSKYKKLLSK